MENALLNLALNARDAMPDGGTITIEAANIDHDPATSSRNLAAGSYVMIAVGDTGIGMTPEVVERAFQPFFTTKDAGQGTGLGLSMVYGFVRQSGGSIEIDSAPGRGSTVRLYLPRGQGAPFHAGPSQLAHGPARGETILVVEDRPDVRRLTSRMLRGLGYRVVEAHDGRSALAVLRAPAPIDLMLADLVLPGGISGVALAAQAHADDPQLKVLFMSAYAPEGLGDRAGGPEPDIGIIKKPFAKDELAAIVRSTLDGTAGPQAKPKGTDVPLRRG